MSAAAASRPAPNPPSLRPPRTRTSPARAALLLACLFLFRLGIGLSSTFWSADERMTYVSHMYTDLMRATGLQ